MKRLLFSTGATVFNLLPDPSENLSSLRNGQKTFILLKAILLFPLVYLSLQVFSVLTQIFS